MNLKTKNLSNSLAKIVIEIFKDYPKDEDEFAGLYGYNASLTALNFLGSSNRYVVF